MSDGTYTSGVAAVSAWRESLFAPPPRRFCVGAGGLCHFELAPERITLIGGAPGAGKTAFAMQAVVDALRKHQDLRALVVSVEMDPTTLLNRQLARLSGVRLDIISKRELTEAHRPRLEDALCTLNDIAGRIAFANGPFNLNRIVEAGDDFKAELLVLDYLQRIEPAGDHTDKRLATNKLMDSLRSFAGGTYAILVVSAMSRGKSKNGQSTYGGDTMNLASFRESSELEYGCDSAYAIIPQDDSGEYVTLKCLKNRHGETRDIPLRFRRDIQRFDSTETGAKNAPNLPTSDEIRG